MMDPKGYPTYTPLPHCVCDHIDTGERVRGNFKWT